MDLMEYKAKELFHKYGIPTMKGIVIDNVDDMALKVEDLTFPLVAKAQIRTGARGKAGGIKIADNIGELTEVSKSILGMNIKGHVVSKLLIEEKLEVIREWYLGIILDRATKGPLVIFSSLGGMDIEETGVTTPEKVIKVSIDPLSGFDDYLPGYLLSKSGSGMEYINQFFHLLKKLYCIFCEYDCLLVEINPLAITDENSLIALDGKISLDDNALYRQPDILSFRDSLPEDALVLEARKLDLLYIPCEMEGSIGVISNGSGMIMSCIDLINSKNMLVGAALDLGGGATADRIRKAIRIFFSNSKIEAVFINIFGGITRCDEVASGIKLAVEEASVEKLVIIRFEGTNKVYGLEILSSIKGNIIAVDSLGEGVNVLHERKGQP